MSEDVRIWRRDVIVEVGRSLGLPMDLVDGRPWVRTRAEAEGWVEEVHEGVKTARGPMGRAEGP